jgi:hypothetical protein
MYSIHTVTCLWRYVAAFFILVSVWLVNVQGQVTIGISPQLDNYIAALDSNSTVEFNCTVTNSLNALQWRVNDTDSAFVDIINSGVSTTQRVEQIDGIFFISVSTLYISTTGENNNTSIRCRTFDESNFTNNNSR